MPEAIQHNLLIRAVNAAGALLRRASIDPLSLDPEVWMARARAETGLDDFDADPQLEEGLSVFAQAVREEAHLSTLGRFGVREHVQNALVTRLRRVALRRAGWQVSPVLEGRMRLGRETLRLVGVGTFQLSRRGDQAQLLLPLEDP